MLESESVLSLPIEARWFYVTILLSADDLGLFEATSFNLARRADIRRESGEALLMMLADADLIRLYEVKGKRYGFIPRFRQRLQIKRSKHPHPPLALVQDDEDALNKIKHLSADPTVGQPLANSYPTAAQPSEPEPEPELEPKPLSITKPKRERGSRLSPDFVMPDEWLSFCRQERPDIDPQYTFEKFKDFWISKATNNTKLDWMATWRNWVRGEKAPRAPAAGMTRQGEATRNVMSGLTRGIVGGNANAKLLLK